MYALSPPFMKTPAGYTGAEYAQLEQTAASLLGRRIILDGLQIEGITGTAIKARTLTTKGKVALAIGSLDLYPTNDAEYQALIESHVKEAGADPKEKREGRVFAKMGMMGNPVVGITLNRSTHATSDPLARLTRLVAVFGEGHVEDNIPWKALLTHDRLTGMKLDPKQMNKFAAAIRWLLTTDLKSPMQVRDMRADADTEVFPPPKKAHEDLHAKLSLTSEGKAAVVKLLQRALKREQE